MPIPAPFPSFTKVWHNDTYATIDPTRPELSMAGKTVVITGAGTGIGAATAKAYAKAGAARIAILARREHVLLQAKKSIEASYPATTVTVHVADVTNYKSMENAAAEVGGWDVLVLNAGYMAKATPVLESDVDEWWNGYEVNVKGVFYSLRALVPNRKANAKVIGISSAAVTLPALYNAGNSAYASSKIAVIKLLETFAAEVPDLFVASIHPGVVVEGSEMAAATGTAGKFPEDTPDLPANYLVWMASEEASFLRGKLTYANFDVTELQSKAKEIQETPVLTTNVVGWPWLGPGAA